MAEIIRFFSENAIVIYIILAIGMIVAGARVWRAWRERHDSVFGLEQELSQKKVNRAIGILVLLFIFFMGELVLDAFLAPILPASLLLSTPTLGVVGYPTNTLSPEMATRVALTPAPTPIPGAVGCVPGQIIIASPSPGQELKGQVSVEGTADIPNFGFYKYEVAPVGSENWSTILAGREVVQDGELGKWNTVELTAGDYLLRLIVTDNQGQALPPCIIPVRVGNQ